MYFTQSYIVSFAWHLEYVFIFFLYTILLCCGYWKNLHSDYWNVIFHQANGNVLLSRMAFEPISAPEAQSFKVIIEGSVSCKS